MDALLNVTGRRDGRTGHRRLACAAAVLLLAGASSASAQDGEHAWLEATDGGFETPENWDPQGPPGEDDQAIFDLHGVYTVDFTSDVINHSLLVRQGRVSFDLAGASGPHTYTLGAVYAFPVTDIGLLVGEQSGDDAELTVQWGGIAADRVHLGDRAGSRGVLMLRDGADLATTGPVHLGHFGTGRLELHSGATLDATGGSIRLADRGGNSFGELLVRDEGSVASTNLSLTIQGRGNILLENGGRINAAQGAWLGSSASAGDATVVVTGQNSLWNSSSGSMLVGDRGVGRLTISDGGEVRSRTGSVASRGSDSVGTVLIEDPGSLWRVGRNMNIGTIGDATLTIRDGGELRQTGNWEFNVARRNDAHAEILVQGPASRLVAGGQMQLGGYRDHQDQRTTGTANLTLELGGLAELRTTHVGNSEDSVGQIFLRHSDTHLHIDGSLVLGRRGIGRLFVDDGATALVSGNTQVATRGPTAWGEVHIEGAQITSLGRVELATASGSTGLADVRAGGLWEIADEVRLGHRGAGELRIGAGGTVVVDDQMNIAEWGSASGHLNVDGGRLEVGPVRIGRRGHGHMRIAAGGEVEQSWAQIGRDPDSLGDVLVTGTDSHWSLSSALTVGYDGTGTLRIADGATVMSTSAAWIGRAFDGHGEVTVAGPSSSWAQGTGIYIGGNNDGAQGTGRLTLADGGRVHVLDSAGALRLWHTGSLDGVGQVDADVFNAGRITPGSPGGTLEVLGSLVQQPGGELSFALAGTGPEAYGHLDVAGTIDFGGTSLGVELVNGFMPTFGDAFKLLSFGDAQGALVPDLPTLSAGTWDATDLASEGVLRVAADFTLPEGVRLWRRPQSGAYHNPDNWYAVGTPQADETVMFGLEALGLPVESPYAIGFDGPLDPSADRVVVRSDEVTLNLRSVLGEFLPTIPINYHLAGESGPSLVVGEQGGDDAMLTLRVGWITGVDGRVGDQTGSAGKLRVTDGAGLELDGPLYGGHGGTGTLEITADSRVKSGSPDVLGIGGQGTYLGYAAGSSGEAVVTGTDATWTIGQSLFVGGSSTAAGGTGTLTLMGDGALIEAQDSVRVWETGTLGGAGTIDAPELINAGVVVAGNSPGTLALGGDYTQLSGATLRIALASVGHGQLFVEGQSELAGQLVLEAVDGGALPFWQELEIISSGDGVSGVFEDERVTGVEGGFIIDVDYRSFSVHVTAGLLGDMNLDGSLDTGDVAPFVLALTDPEAYEAQYGIDPAIPGDINGDGSFDTGDVAPFVNLLVGGGSPQSVPEPGSLVLLSTGVMLLMRRRQQRRT